MMRCPLKENKDRGQYFSHSTNSFPMSSYKKQERGHLTYNNRVKEYYVYKQVYSKSSRIITH